MGIIGWLLTGRMKLRDGDYLYWRTLRYAFLLLAAIAAVVLGGPIVTHIFKFDSHLTDALFIGLAVVVSAAVIVTCLWVLVNRALARIRDEIQLQIGGAVSLIASIKSEALPPLGGASMSPAAVSQLASLIAFDRPRVIVELGAGSSTIFLARLKRELGTEQRIISIEHDEGFARIARARLGDTSDCRVVHAAINKDQDPVWYDIDTVLSCVPEGVELLIVDGPPDVKGTGCRGAALPVLRDKLAQGCRIFVDDWDRTQEQGMVVRWQNQDSDLKLIIGGRDHVVLELQ